MDNRKFKCYDCNNEWDLPHGTGIMGIDLNCPKCNSSNVHRVNGDRYGNRMGFCRLNNPNLTNNKN